MNWPDIRIRLGAGSYFEVFGVGNKCLGKAFIDWTKTRLAAMQI